MFNIQNTERSGNFVTFEVKYAFGNNEREHIIPFTGSNRYCQIQFAHIAFDFLKITIDEFYEAIIRIHPHYFNSNAIPYLWSDTTWTFNYWKFLALRDNLLKSNCPKKYAELIQQKNLTGLIPELQNLNRARIKALITDLQQVSKLLLTTISKIQANECTIHAR